MSPENKDKIFDSLWKESREQIVPKTKKSKFSFLKNKKFWKIFGIVSSIIIFGIIFWVGGSFVIAWNKISDSSGNNRSPLSLFSSRPDTNQLKGEGDGRINILVLGMGGSGHPGGFLTDTIMVVSIDPVQKSIGMLSIPRDLYVPIPGNGKNKINVAYSYGEANKNELGGGPQVAKGTVSEILDLPMHYFLKLDFDGFVKFVDAIEGVDIDVPRAISDPYYPDENMVGYKPFTITKGIHHLDGQTALKYVRSRETTSDFDRAKRQQQIIKVIKDKVFSAGTWSNPLKITEMINVLGDNIRTDFSANEIKRLLEIVKNIDETKIATKVLKNGDLVEVDANRGIVKKLR